jgi:hypothetical protein
MSDEDARIPLLHGEERDDQPWRATRRARFGLMVAVAAVAGVAYGGMTGSFRTALTSTGLSVDDRPTLYALLDHEGFAMQLKNLQCYKKMAKDAGMQLAVGPFLSSHFDSEMHLEDLVDNSGLDWRSMTNSDWQRVIDAGGPDLCITAERKGMRDGVKYATPGGGEIQSDPNTVITSYKKVIKELTTRPWWTCLGALVFEECAGVDSQIDFKPSAHITEVMRIARKALFDGDSDQPFRMVHMRRGDRCLREKWKDERRCRDGEEQPFLDMCQEAKAGMGLPVYVATDDTTDELHDALHRNGCLTVRNITGFDMLQDWESAGMDQFLLSEAEEHFSMGCSTMDAVASASRRIRNKNPSKVFVKSAGAFLEIPEATTEVSCEAATKKMVRDADAGKAAEDQFTDRVTDAAAAVAAQIEQEEKAKESKESQRPADKDEPNAQSERRGSAEEASRSSGISPDASTSGGGEGIPRDAAKTGGGSPREPAQPQDLAQDLPSRGPAPVDPNDRVSVLESEVFGIKDGMRNMMATLFNIQQAVSGDGGDEEKKKKSRGSSEAEAEEEEEPAIEEEDHEHKVKRLIEEAAKRNKGSKGKEAGAPPGVIYPPPLAPLQIEDLAAYEAQMMHYNED